MPVVQFRNQDDDGKVMELGLKEDHISAIKDAKWLILDGSYGAGTNIKAAAIAKDNDSKVILDLQDGKFSSE